MPNLGRRHRLLCPGDQRKWNDIAGHAEHGEARPPLSPQRPYASVPPPHTPDHQRPHEQATPNNKNRVKAFQRYRNQGEGEAPYEHEVTE